MDHPVLTPKQLDYLLGELCSGYGFSLPVRQPHRMEESLAKGIDAFTDAVFDVEGMDPRLHQSLWREVREFVVKRIADFQR